MSETNDRLFGHDRRRQTRHVCGADEAGHAAGAGPLVAVAVRFDHRRLTAGSEAVKRLEYLNDSKEGEPGSASSPPAGHHVGRLGWLSYWL